MDKAYIIREIAPHSRFYYRYRDEVYFNLIGARVMAREVSAREKYSGWQSARVRWDSLPPQVQARTELKGFAYKDGCTWLVAAHLQPVPEDASDPALQAWIGDRQISDEEREAFQAGWIAYQQR